MAKQLTLARPYAKAIFELASAQRLLQPWSDLLKILSYLVTDERVASYLTNPTIIAADCKKLLLDLVDAVAAKTVTALGHTFKNFITLLIDEKRFILLPDIAILYHQLLMAKEGMMEAEIISAFPLNQDHREQLKNALETRFHSKMALSFLKEENLIGGVLIRAGNWVMDASVKGKLTRLAENLRSGMVIR